MNLLKKILDKSKNISYNNIVEGGSEVKRLINSSYRDIEGMSRIGEIPMRGCTFEIYVNTDYSGKIPHFHVRNKNDWNLFHTCVRIDCPEYFLHGNKQDKFNTKEKKVLNEFMSEPCKKPLFDENGIRLNNWKYLCTLWDINNSDVEIDPKTIQPDYTLL